MNLSNEFNPIPKPQTEKRKPKVKQKKPKKKKRNPLKQEIYKGRTIPTKQQRGKISTKEYNKAIEAHGYECFFCGKSTDLECHHVVPKGISKTRNGRGVYFNLRFLCSDCHRGENGVHQDKKKMELLQRVHEQLYGPHFYKDRFDLFKEGLISNTSIDSYEDFMKKEQNTPN